MNREPNPFEVRRYELLVECAKTVLNSLLRNQEHLVELGKSADIMAGVIEKQRVFIATTEASLSRLKTTGTASEIVTLE